LLVAGKISACNWVKSLLAAGGSVWKSRARDARCTPKAEHVAARLAQRIDRAHCKIHWSECKKVHAFFLSTAAVVANTDHVVDAQLTLNSRAWQNNVNIQITLRSGFVVY
jgi:hypothetical protein